MIGDGFVWAHLPKTGGDATAEMFKLFPEITSVIDSAAGNQKHRHFADSGVSTVGKVLAMNIRQLPAWILSYAHHKATRGFYPTYVPQAFDAPEEMAQSTEADRLLRLFTANGAFTVDRWLRTECLAEDFIDFTSMFATVTEARRQDVLALGSVNRATYDHDYASRFTTGQLNAMYTNNPMWAEVELQAYGSLVAASAPASARPRD